MGVGMGGGVLLRLSETDGPAPSLGLAVSLGGAGGVIASLFESSRRGGIINRGRLGDAWFSLIET